jgi:hypothetical protein
VLKHARAERRALAGVLLERHQVADREFLHGAGADPQRP